MRSLQIGYDSKVQQQKSWAVQISKLHSGGQITERRIHIYAFCDESMRCCDLGVCTACKSSLQFTPHFTITSIQFTKVTLNSQYFQAKPRRCSHRVALSCRELTITTFRTTDTWGSYSDRSMALLKAYNTSLRDSARP
jgi:hypothetical protein